MGEEEVARKALPWKSIRAAGDHRLVPTAVMVTPFS